MGPARSVLKNVTSSSGACVTVVACLLALLLICCRSSSASAPLQAAAPLPFLHLQKPPCFGSCPAYNATVFTDGSIRFIRWREVPFEGDTVTLQLAPEALQKLQALKEKLHVDVLKKSYLSKWTDTPTFYLTFYAAGKVQKRIKHQEGGPEELLYFEKELNRILLQLAETHTP